MGELAVVSAEVVKEIKKAGYEPASVKVGKLITVYYFNDCKEIRQVVTDKLIQLK